MVPERFAAVLAELAPLAERFDAAGHRLYLVGGAVRDLLVGADTAGSDLDLTTDARPPEIRRAIAGWADAVWAQGEAFGTIGASRTGADGTVRRYEITTFRAEVSLVEVSAMVTAEGDRPVTDLTKDEFEILEDGARRPIVSARFLSSTATRTTPLLPPSLAGARLDEVVTNRDLADALQDTAQLIKADLGTSAVAIDFGSWDMHSDYGTTEWGDMQSMTGALARVLSAFLRDLGARYGLRSGHNGFTYGLLHGRIMAAGDTLIADLRPFL